VNILFVGDVFGSPGRRIVREHLPHLLETHAVDLLVINGENAAGGFGITPSIAEEIFDLGAHVITTGNHIWDKREIFEYMDVPAHSAERGRRIIRPANYAAGTPGFGFYEGELPNGQTYAVMNLQAMTRSGRPTSCWTPSSEAQTPGSSCSMYMERHPAKRSPSGGIWMAASRRSSERIRISRPPTSAFYPTALPTRPMWG
jgi:calcineurin-like phosphoesterase